MREKFWQTHDCINIECKGRQAGIHSTGDRDTLHSPSCCCGKMHTGQREKEQRVLQTISVHVRALAFMQVYVCILNSVLFSAYKCVQSKAVLTCYGRHMHRLLNQCILYIHAERCFVMLVTPYLISVKLKKMICVQKTASENGVG